MVWELVPLKEEKYYYFSKTQRRINKKSFETVLKGVSVEYTEVSSQPPEKIKKFFQDMKYVGCKTTFFPHWKMSEFDRNPKNVNGGESKHKIT